MIYTIDDDRPSAMWIRSRLFHVRKGDYPSLYKHPTPYDAKTSYGARAETIAPTCLEGWGNKFLTDQQT